VTPPPIFLLQVFNALVAFGGVLCIMIGVATWGGHHWQSWQIGLATTAVNLCYGGLVAQGGRLADRWGRAQAGLAGTLVGLAGCVAALVIDHPAMALVAAMLGFSGQALFFPGAAGLFSDAEGASGRPAPALNRKVSHYNLGWAAGNLACFFAFGLVGSDVRIGYAVAAAAFLAVFAALWRWRRLPPRPPPPVGDRAPHPALPRLTLMSRVNLFLGCVLGMALMTQLQHALAHELPERDAVRITSLVLTCYAASYIAVFVVLGRWTGWILRPWRLWVCQLGFLLGAIGLLVAATIHPAPVALLAGCGACIGSGYGSAYTSSIYYSLRLPHGAARAAGLHETFIGLGNTCGPLFAGAFLSTLVGALPGLGIFVTVLAVAGLAFQAAMIPGAVRLGARGEAALPSPLGAA
jgi:MFS family permease